VTVRDGDSMWVYSGNGNGETVTERDLQGEVDLVVFSELGFLGSSCACVLVGLDETILSQRKTILFTV
jgi:hypothetical protein